MVYEITSVGSSIKTEQILINETTAQFLNIPNGQTILISFGNRKQSVTVKIDSYVQKDALLISEQIIESLLIDPKSRYEINYKNNELIIGPVIGLLLGRTDKRLIGNLDRYLIYTLLFERINGVLFIFSEEHIDFINEQITGYVYDPNDPNCWRKTVLPFPGAIFRRVELSQKTIKGLKEKMGKGFFNSVYFDKWDFWKWLSPYKDLREHLPETSNKINIQQLDTFIEIYKSAYLKPINGSRGNGIHLVEKHEDQYIVSKNYQSDITVMTKDEMTIFLSKHSYYLLQQPIQLQPYENRKVDYRVILQKNETGFWQCTGIIARFGKTNAISSNFKANGFAKHGIEALMIQFGYDERKAFQKYQEIVHICTKMAEKVDEIEAYADLGIDVGIDEDEKIWVIEMNKRPDHDFPLIIKDRKMYYLVKSNPILYAKYVAMGRP